MQLLGPIGSLEAYISIVNQAPVLTREEEYALTVRFKENNEYYGIGWYSYFGDILGWIPSQILPIEKNNTF